MPHDQRPRQLGSDLFVILGLGLGSGVVASVLLAALVMLL